VGGGCVRVGGGGAVGGATVGGMAVGGAVVGGGGTAVGVGVAGGLVQEPMATAGSARSTTNATMAYSRFGCIGVESFLLLMGGDMGRLM